MYHLTALVTLLAILVYFYSSVLVSRARGTFGVKLPAISGNPDFERVFRAQMNTLEWLPIFLPSLWLFAIYVSDGIAAAIGLVWVIDPQQDATPTRNVTVKVSPAARKSRLWALRRRRRPARPMPPGLRSDFLINPVTSMIEPNMIVTLSLGAIAIATRPPKRSPVLTSSSTDPSGWTAS